MPNTITAQFYTDPQIAAIRSNLQQKTDGLPFLLLPVRIETRFREFTRIVSAAQQFSVEQAMEALGELHLSAIRTQKSVSGPGLRTVQGSAEKLQQAMKDLPPLISTQEKGWLKQLAFDLDQDVQYLTRNAPAGLENEGAQLAGTCKQLLQAINERKVLQQPQLPEARALIDSFTRVLQNLQQLNGGPGTIPYYNFKNKKALYGHVNRVIQQTKAFVDALPGDAARIPYIKKNQVDRIAALKVQVATQLQSVERGLGSIHPDEAWKRFAAKVTAEQLRPITEAVARFDREVLPALRSVPAAPDKQTGDLYFLGIKTLIKIRRLNQEEKRGYETLKRFRKYITPQINALAAGIKQEIAESRPQQGELLTNLYASITKELNTAVSNIQQYPARNTSQQYGKTLLLDFFAKEALPVVESLGSKDQPLPFKSQGPQTVYQLLVRIFPDDIFVDTHEPELTAAELEAGKAFWKYWWIASNDKDQETAAWENLCAALGLSRAAWVARCLNPMLNSTPENVAAKQNKPSLETLDAIALLNSVVGKMAELPQGKNAKELFAWFSSNSSFLTGIKTSLDGVLQHFTAQYEQDYLVEKVKSALMQIKAGWSYVETKEEELSEADKATYILQRSQIHFIGMNLGKVQGHCGVIQALPLRELAAALPEPFVYPNLPLKTAAWSKAPVAKALPQRFVVVTIKGGVCQHIAVTKPVSYPLQLGLDPANFQNGNLYQIDSNGNLQVEPGLQWMTDYTLAVEKGMAVTIEISQTQYDTGFDKVIVLGVNEGTANQSTAAFEELITSHIYSPDGMEFLKTGTPTNNTQQRSSGFEPEGDAQQRYEIEVNGKPIISGDADKWKMADGDYFSLILGINNYKVKHVSNADNLEVANALAMNRSLWGATLGHYMEEMFDGVFTYDNIRRAEHFFTTYVTGRGMLPSFRIGAQPYGILATTAFSKLKLYNTPLPTVSHADMLQVKPWAGGPAEQQLQQRFEMRLLQFLNTLQSQVWTPLRNQHVVHAGNLHSGNPQAEDAQQRFIKMLGLHATSLEYYYRYGLNIAKGPNTDAIYTSTNFATSDAFGPNSVKNSFATLMKGGKYTPSFDFNEGAGGFPAWMLEIMLNTRILRQMEESRLFNARWVDRSMPVKGAVIEHAPLSDTALLAKLPDSDKNYINWLLEAKATELLGGNQVNDPTRIPANSMLFLMLRQSLLQGYQEAALNMMQRESVIWEEQRRQFGNCDNYFYAYGFNDFYYNTKWHFLFRNLEDLVSVQLLSQAAQANNFYKYITGQTGPAMHSMATYLDQVRTVGPQAYPGQMPFFDKLKKTRSAVECLQRVPTAGLDILLAEHIDLCTYRLDAWYTGLVNKRLMDKRKQNPGGLYLGAWGYVENLRRDTNKTAYSGAQPLTPFKLPAGKPVYHDPDNQGFIHAPSIAQAITAAVLRNAYKTNGSQEIQNRLAVNLSSARVRMALQLIEGIRNGQETGALLGFQFERGLHERYKTVELDKFIQPFRKAFPLQQQVVESANGAPAYVSLVVNGSAILDVVHNHIGWLQSDTAKYGQQTIAEILKANNYSQLPPAIKTVIDSNLSGADLNKPAIYNAIIEEIDRMADAFDALGDVAVSESVYQLVQGNHVRAAAVLTALAEGKNIPDPQVINIHRSGTIVTQRVMLNLQVKDGQVKPAGWDGEASVRFLTEPSFNHWLASAFGPAANIRYVITKEQENQPPLKISASLADLNWQPIDLFYLPGGEDELREILLQTYRKAQNDYDSTPGIAFKERAAQWGAADKTIADVLLMIKNIRSMVSNARNAGAAELVMPDTVTDNSNPNAFDVTELYGRVKNTYLALDLLRTTLAAEAYLAPVLSGETAPADVPLTAAGFNSIFAHLQTACAFGIPHALSFAVTAGATPGQRYTAALQHLINIYNEVLGRCQQAAALLTEIDKAAVARTKADKLSDLAAIVLGKGFRVIPLYAFDANPIREQLQLPALQKITRHNGLMAMEDWLHSVAKVRRRVYDVTMYMQLTDVYELPVAGLQPCQFPYKAGNGDHWLGLPYPSNYKPLGDSLSLVMINDQALNTGNTFCGLVLDEWLEIIPGKEETSGIAFNYNQPNAAAPQTLLLAVTPENTNVWEWDNLVHTIIDTMEMAKNRAVEPDHLEKSILSHVLPGIVSEVAPPQYSNNDENPLGVQAVMDFSHIKPKTV